MKAYVHAFDHPYFQITDEDGRFEFENLPPGNYTITAWHERFLTLNQTVTLSGGSSAEIKLVYRKPKGVL